MCNSHLEQTVLIMEYLNYKMPVAVVAVMDIPVLVVLVVQQ